MGLLEQIEQMKNQGKTEQEIVTELQEQGISPKEIQDALNHSQIKQAISKENEEETQASLPANNLPPSPNTPTQNYEPPVSQEEPQQNTYYPSQQSQESYTNQQYNENYAPEEYGQEQGYAQESLDTDTIIEISEQVFSEKIKDLQKQTEKMQEFSTIATTKIKDLQNRLKRIETTIDKLQLSILDKVGSYGKDLESIKNEMSMIESNFSKLISKKKKKKTT